jgi:type IV secretory pathway TrbD component
MSERPRALAIHASLIRPILLLGAERTLVMLAGIVAAVLVLSLERPLFAVAGVVFWTLSVAALQRAAKVDPQLSQVYLRHVRYGAYYAAQSRATARLATIREQLPC